MKRQILAFIVLASIFCSCQKNAEYTPTREEGLMQYAYGLFYDMVTTPAIAMNVAYEFQNFLNLSDEQRKSHIFANMVVQYDINRYALLLRDGLGYLIVDTNGCDLDTPGKEWNMYCEVLDLYEYLKMTTPCYDRYSDINLKIECKDVRQWNISGNAREGMCRMTLADDKMEERVWLACTSGSETETGATGIRSDYSTHDVTQEGENFEISFHKYAVDDIQTCSFNGTFLVLISSFDDIKERALVFGKPGFAINCITETRFGAGN